jgi:repressor LexA
MEYESLSERQRAILKFIQSWADEHGYPPTIREIGKAVKINSTSVVNYNLNKLVKEGFISRSKDVSRGIRVNGPLQELPVNIVDSSHAFLQVPMLGRIVAGEPVPTPEDVAYPDEESMMPVPRALIGNADASQVYGLVVNGHSMIDAMINDGDTVILRRQQTARNGEMVAVWLNERGETTLKYFFDEGEQIRLQPANPLMNPIYVDKDKVQVQGRVLAVLRRVH